MSNGCNMGVFGIVGVAAALIIKDKLEAAQTPEEICALMKAHENPVIREFGLRIEVALLKAKERRGDESPRTGQETISDNDVGSKEGDQANE